MGLDYARGCVNFRDVGECLNLIANRVLLPIGRLLRGGKLGFVQRPDQIGNPGTIINLRLGPDPAESLYGADYWQIAISNEHEKYNTSDPKVRRWLNDVIECLACQVTRYPVLIHCTSGKDRTGVVIAAILTILGVERELVVQEYLWSEGEVERTWIEGALDGIGDPSQYFRRVDLTTLRAKVVGT